MKPLIIVGLIGAGMLLTGCETTVVEHDHHHGYGYHGDSSAVYVDSSYRNGHGHDYYDHNYHGDYRTRNVERTNVNISETNVNRTTVNRTNVNQNIKKSPHTGTQPATQAQTHVQKKGEDKERKGHDKKKDNQQQQ